MRNQNSSLQNTIMDTNYLFRQQTPTSVQVYIITKERSDSYLAELVGYSYTFKSAWFHYQGLPIYKALIRKGENSYVKCTAKEFYGW